MTLSFSQTINGKPNYFIEKIWNGLIEKQISTISDYQNRRFEYNDFFEIDWDHINDYSLIQPKLHTIREDPHNRWKPGNLIHPVINNRTANRFQFAPVIKCVSVQTIIIRYNEKGFSLIFVDGILLYGNQKEAVVKNDGFDSIEDFFAFFNKDFTGKIIHFTDLKY